MSATSTNCSMSIVRVLRGSTASRSSSVTITVLPLSSSKLRVIDSNGTSLSSSEHQRCVSTGTLSFSWSWRKWRSMSRTAVTSWTGTFTSPKLSDPVQSERATLLPPLPAPARHARLERRHQVVRIVRGLAALRQRLHLALRLRLDVLEQPLAVGVLELLRLELVLERVDELARHVELGLLGVSLRARDVEVLDRHELVVEAHRVHREDAVADGAERHEVLAVVEDPAADAGATGLVERVVQQAVGVLAVVLRAEVVGLVEQHGVDVAGADELLDLDEPRARAGRCLDLVLLEHHVLAVGDLIAADDLLVRDLLAFLRADALVLDAGAVVDVHLVEVDGLALGRGMDLHGHVHAAERDRAVPDGFRTLGRHSLASTRGPERPFIRCRGRGRGVPLTASSAPERLSARGGRAPRRDPCRGPAASGSPGRRRPPLSAGPRAGSTRTVRRPGRPLSHPG